jgi:hypothetical protein
MVSRRVGKDERMGRAFLITGVVLEQEFGWYAGKAVVWVRSVAGLAGFVAILARLCWLIDEVVQKTGVLTRVVESSQLAGFALMTVELGSEEADVACMVATVAILVNLRIVLADSAVYHAVVIQRSGDSSGDTAGTLMDSRSSAFCAISVTRQICVRFNIVVKFTDQRHELAVTAGQKGVRGVAGETAVPRLLAAGLAPVMALHASRSLQIGSVGTAQTGRRRTELAAGQTVRMALMALVREPGGVKGAWWTCFLAEARSGAR